MASLASMGYHTTAFNASYGAPGTVHFAASAPPFVAPPPPPYYAAQAIPVPPQPAPMVLTTPVIPACMLTAAHALPGFFTQAQIGTIQQSVAEYIGQGDNPALAVRVNVKIQTE
jgi:hypothetical protein